LRCRNFGNNEGMWKNGLHPESSWPWTHEFENFRK